MEIMPNWFGDFEMSTQHGETDMWALNEKRRDEMRLWLENADVALLTVGDGFLLPAALQNK